MAVLSHHVTNNIMQINVEGNVISNEKTVKVATTDI